jgi:ParB family chromosome partitioning protein
MEKYVIKPSLSGGSIQANETAGTLTLAVIDSVLAEEKKPPKTTPTSGAHYRKFFPPDYSPKQIETVTAVSWLLISRLAQLWRKL